MPPLMINLAKRSAVIIGGGKVACKRAETLIDHGAKVTIISPDIIEGLQALYQRNEIQWKNKKFEPDDIQGAFIAVIATNDLTENQRITAAAENVPLLNRADGGEGGNLHFPAHFTRGKLTIAVSTGGASPMLASHLKRNLEVHFPPDYEHYIDFLYECRQILKRSGFSREVKQDILEKILEDSYQDPAIQRQMLEEIKKAGEEKEFDRIRR
ncbi:NAD(P)-binding protein [Halobacillus sp. H74]|uniref:NAD(P)-binding protein n=1 Tax=Halobacillus sp. H74 TaxID=3457436 RepID=UPI003FCE4C5B